MSVQHAVLLFTDVVDSTFVTGQLGDESASQLWSEHDRLARKLMREWGGVEIDKSDGFLLRFDGVAEALAFAAGLHAGLATLDPPLHCRTGIHRAPMIARTNHPEDVAKGAKPVELDGIGKAVTARIMMLARGGQTLLSAEARGGFDERGSGWQLRSHGHWRLKGLAEPIEVFEAGDAATRLVPPLDSSKAYCVVHAGDGWQPRAALPNSLPAERDSFVGRTSALDALARRFDEPGVRLVTLHGIGGIGKTRLALRYARLWLGDFPGGAWFCDLSPARTLDGLVHAVARGVDVVLGRSDPVRQIGDAIVARGECLVVLDNFEQVSRLAEVSLGCWLEQASAARFLVTSRETLAIAGEHSVEVAPMSNDEAVRLFEQRARAAGADGSGPTEGAMLGRLVQMLDHLPLAIELAASRSRVMPVASLIDRMGERFVLLARRGARHDRQATMRAALDWSWELLSEVEQSVLAQLSVFEGGFTLEAAECVLQLGGTAAPVRVAEWLQQLVEKSLIRLGPGYRFSLLQCVHDYAAERAGALGLEASARRRHSRYFASIGEAAATAGRCADLENLVAACRRAATDGPGDPEAAVGALVNAWAALRLTGPFRVALELVAAMEATGGLSTAQRGEAGRIAGTAHALMGQTKLARQRYQQAMADAVGAGNMAGQVRLMCLQASLDGGRGFSDDARAKLDQALAMARAADDRALELIALNGLAAALLRQGQHDAAEALYTVALSIAQRLDDRRWLGGIHGNLGIIAHQRGDGAAAGTHYAAALAGVGEVGDRQWEGNMRCSYGLLLHEQGQSAAAQRELEAALSSARALGHRRLEATALCNLGIVLGALPAATSEALEPLAAAVLIAHDLADHGLESQFRGYLGLALAQAAKTLATEACFNEAFRLLDAIGGAPDAASRALLCCQRAEAAAVRGDAAALGQWAQAAEEAVAGEVAGGAPLHVAPTSELGRALDRVRQHRGVVGVSSPR